MNRRWILESISLLLFILFTYTAGSKLANYNLFIFQMQSQPFDDRFTYPLAIGLLVIEFAIAACLIFKRTLRIGLWTSLVMLLIFTGYIVLIKMNYFDKVPCSCGGVIEQLNWTQHLFFNLFFVAINIWGLVINKLPSRQQVQLS